MINEKAVEILTEHRIEAHGMSMGSPDRCACGVRTLPEDGDEYPEVRRARAFAAHQIDMLATAEVSS